MEPYVNSYLGIFKDHKFCCNKHVLPLLIRTMYLNTHAYYTLYLLRTRYISRVHLVQLPNASVFSNLESIVYKVNTLNLCSVPFSLIDRRSGFS